MTWAIIYLSAQQLEIKQLMREIQIKKKPNFEEIKAHFQTIIQKEIKEIIIQSKIEEKKKQSKIGRVQLTELKKKYFEKLVMEIATGKRDVKIFLKEFYSLIKEKMKTIGENNAAWQQGMKYAKQFFEETMRDDYMEDFYMEFFFKPESLKHKSYFRKEEIDHYYNYKFYTNYSINGRIGSSYSSEFCTDTYIEVRETDLNIDWTKEVAKEHFGRFFDYLIVNSQKIAKDMYNRQIEYIHEIFKESPEYFGYYTFLKNLYFSSIDDSRTPKKDMEYREIFLKYQDNENLKKFLEDDDVQKRSIGVFRDLWHLYNYF